ncbi:putative PEP-CTERM protein-sorting domain-containing protein [Candidatus Magnetomoraceae bacterium gMMP-15]
MKKALQTATFLLAAIFFISEIAMATTLGEIVKGENITIFDGQNKYNSGWFGTQEDQEVEHNSLTGQQWDLEAFYWDDLSKTLFAVGGFDFKDGQSSRETGDLFFFGDVVDYVFDFKRNNNDDNLKMTENNDQYDSWTGNYNIKKGNSLDTTGVTNNTVSTTDFTYDGTYDKNNYTEYEYKFYEGLTDGLGLTGGSHYVMEFAGLDSNIVNAITNGSELHLTMECGNDDLRGKNPTSAVPEPSTILLFSIGIIGLVGLRRKFNS